MSDTAIVGISLVQNEDVFIEQAILNVLDFCDELIIADNNSTDNTGEIVKRLARDNSKIRYKRIDNPSESHKLIQGCAGANTWIFGVDGDEIYDPNGLGVLRQKLLDGEYDEYWTVFGNVLHCVDIDTERKIAKGYLSPPCRSMTKLYNFSGIAKWDKGAIERLHGGDVSFKDGYSWERYLRMNHQISWNDSPYRCLHTCFLRRSSLDTEGRYERENIMERAALGFKEKFLRFISPSKTRTSSRYKYDQYMQGELGEFDVSSFFN